MTSVQWRSSSPIVKLWVPVRSSAFGSEVEHQPKGVKIGSSARILSGVGHLATHLATVKMPDHAIATCEYAEARHVCVLRADIRPCVIPREVRNEWEVGEIAILFVREKPLDRGSGGHRYGHPSQQIDSDTVPAVQKRRTHRTRFLPLWAVHHAVNHQSIAFSEQIPKATRAGFG